MFESQPSHFLTARDCASFFGFRARTRDGKPTNHSTFLRRMEDRYPDFPKPRWNGTRKLYDLAELEAFKKTLPTEKPQRRAA